MFVSAFSIKLVALLTMLIDHTGYYLVPDLLILRIIGRLSFPLFAWLIANGAKHTKNINKYLVRLFVFGVISQIPFALAHNQAGVSYGLNIMFTLFLGLSSIKVVNTKLSIFKKYLLVIVIALIAHFADVSYGLIGVFSVLGFYIFYENKKMMLLFQSFLYIAVHYLLILVGETQLDSVTIMQPLSLAALPFIQFYNGKSGPKLKYLFYIIYPLQYVVFYLLLRWVL